MMTDSLVRRYLIAKRTVIDAGFGSEVGWQAAAADVAVTVRSFTEQAAWVIMSAGMSEMVVRERFPSVACAFHGFDVERIIRDATCRRAALEAFGHERKVDAIFTVASWAHELGDAQVRHLVEIRDEPTLTALPFIGPATVRHLLKNLGAPVAKPDRHLLRVAAACDRAVDGLCAEIAEALGEPIGVVDIVLWRWASLHVRGCRQPCDGLPHQI
jgi:hypothetical protein